MLTTNRLRVVGLLLSKRNKEGIGELLCQVESPARASTIL